MQVSIYLRPPPNERPPPPPIERPEPPPKERVPIDEPLPLPKERELLPIFEDPLPIERVPIFEEELGRVVPKDRVDILLLPVLYERSLFP